MIIFTVQRERTITYRESPEELIEAIDNTERKCRSLRKSRPSSNWEKNEERNNAVGCGKEDSRACC